ncbi:MAG TPA: PDZ domain-containing protein [Candidatus Binataceae bacterium]|nr:PDZ domain-containing protein [Candidatus Binataceae bacterium]
MRGASSKTEDAGRGYNHGSAGVMLAGPLVLALILFAPPCGAQSSPPASSGALTAPLTPALSTALTNQSSASTSNPDGPQTQSAMTPSQASGASIWSGDPVVQYEHAQPPEVGDITDYTNDDAAGAVPPLGISVREDSRKLASGGEASGLLVVAVQKNGPAAGAGLKAYSHRARTAVEVAAVATTVLVFPPAMFAVPMLEASQMGDSYYLIIGVDGTRVTDLEDIVNCMRDVQPGEIVYLSLIHNGVREQLPLTIPPLR